MEKTDRHSSPDSSPLGEGVTSICAKEAAGMNAPTRLSSSGVGSDGDEPDEISLKDLILKLRDWWKYLWPKWPVILIFGIIGGGIGYYGAYIKKPVYKAELSFALEDAQSGGGLGGALGLASQFGLNVGGNGGGVFVGDNLIELMKSRSMVEKTLLSTVVIEGKRVTLAELYISFKGFRESWKKQSELANIQFSPGADRTKFSLKQDSILGILHKDLVRSVLTVDKLDKRLSIIIVRVVSENELFAKYFTEVLAKEVSDFYVETKTKRSVQNVAILQHQTDSVRRALNRAITGVAVSMDVNPNPNPARQILSVPSQSRQVDVLANQSILTELVKNLELSKVSLRNETPLIQLIDKPILPLEKQTFSKFKPFVIGIILGSMIAIFIFVLKRIWANIMV